MLYPLLAYLSIYYHHGEIAAFYLLGLFAFYLLARLRSCHT